METAISGALVGAKRALKPSPPDFGALFQTGPSKPIAVAHLELIAQRLRRMVRDQLQRYVGHQVLKQPADDLVAVLRFDIPHVDDAFGWAAGRGR